MFFFFQAEDGIRDGRVTGVQTCALPICRTPQLRHRFEEFGSATDAVDALSVPSRLDGRYQAIVLSGTKVRAYDRDHYKPLVDLVMTADVPVFGICGGMQILAVSAGGRLAEGPQRVGGYEVQVAKA